MFFSGCSAIEFFSWLIGILLIYEVIVYLFYTYVKRPVASKNNTVWKNDFSEDEETESEIEKLNRLNEEAFSSIETETVEGYDDDTFEEELNSDISSTDVEYTVGGISEEINVGRSSVISETNSFSDSSNSSDDLESFFNSFNEESNIVEQDKLTSKVDLVEQETCVKGWPFESSNIIDFEGDEQVLFDEDSTSMMGSEDSGIPPYLSSEIIDFDKD